MRENGAGPRARLKSWSRRQFLGGAGALSLAAMASGREASAQPEASVGREFALENAMIRVVLSVADGSFSVLDKRSGLTWRQQVRPGFRVLSETVTVAPTMLSANVEGPEDTYSVTWSFAEDAPHAFDLVIEVPNRRYAVFPGYPFPFAAPGKGWYYVQNTTGEGMLMPLDKEDEIVSAFDWDGSQPWWGITDLNQAMRARLDTFRLPLGKDATVYAAPLRINYAFFIEGGYVGLAKEYRNDFLRSHPEMRPLHERTKTRPAVDHLKDAVYVYLWGASPTEDLEVVTEMKAAGIERGIAVFNGQHEMDHATCDAIKQLGWVMGKYQMPTGNLFHVSKQRHWNASLLTGELEPGKFFAGSNRPAWDRVCGKQILKEWPEKAKAVIDEFGIDLFYFDTMVVQMAPCLSPDHPSTVEENQQARLEIMRQTREMGIVVGSGEGNCPTWALPGLDFFEGLMSPRTYADMEFSVGSGGYAKDFTPDEYREQASFVLDETRRIPLYQLGFHDYVAGSWVWRDTNYQCTAYAWKKDLFNILYATIPMWHINRSLWESRKANLIASYRNIASVRQRIGFAEMLNHGWLTEDRSVQFTDWETGDRVIVNFGDLPYERNTKPPVAQRSFVVERTPD